MKANIIVIAALALAACTKEQPAASVSLEAAGVWCAIQVEHNGTITRDTIGAFTPLSSQEAMARYATTFTALVDDQVSITAHSLQEAGRSVLVSAKVDDHVQGFEYVIPTGADSATPVSIRFVVPELDRYGSPK